MYTVIKVYLEELRDPLQEGPEVRPQAHKHLQHTVLVDHIKNKIHLALFHTTQTAVDQSLVLQQNTPTE